MWNEIKMSLPPNSKTVLVWCPERFNTYACHWKDGKWTISGSYGDVLQEIPSHWMHLPEPPKEEASGTVS